MSHSERKEMVIGDDKILSIRKQCKILRISRSVSRQTKLD